MKQIKLYISILAFMLLFIAVFIFNACRENTYFVSSTEDTTSDVEITINGKNLETCNGATTTNAASGASLLIIYYNTETCQYDSITSTLDDNGLLNETIPDSKFGVSNIKFIATYNSNIFEDSVDFMCCDTSITFNFETDCDEIKETELTCESIDTTVSLTLTNQYGGCLILGASEAEIKWNTVSFSGNEDITLDISSIVNLDGKFSANISPQPDNEELNLGNNSTVTISFYVETNEVGTFDTTLYIPSTCTDSLDNTSTGEIEIEIEAEICEDACSCPFSNDGEINKTFDKSSEGVLIGTSETYTNQLAFDIENGMLDEDCYIQVTGINRYNDDASAYSIENVDDERYDWIITSPTTFPEKLILGDAYYLSATFTPDRSGESADTFDITVVIYNQLDEAKDTCSFLVTFNGLGCENMCPQITILSKLEAELVDALSQSVIQTLSIGDILDMDNQTTIEQSMSGTLGTLCQSWTTGGGSVSYLISLPDSEEVVTCSDVQLSFDLYDSDNGTTGDYKYFDVTAINKSLSEGESAYFTVEFETPSLNEHLSSSHGSTYYSMLTVTATDSDGNVICSQNFEFETEVTESTSNISESQSMKAFSQISDKENEPSYQVYKIDEYDEQYYYFGKVDNLSEGVGDIDLTSTPPIPQTDHSFYFEVDEPENTSLRQEPKLYLVNSTDNVFSQITSAPIANYSSNSNFSDDLDNLVENIFESSFQSQGTTTTTNFTFSSSSSSTMWTPSSSASDLSGSGNGISLTLGDVYIIWNSDAAKESLTIGSNTYSDYCQVALLYIDGISNGEDTNHNIGNVSFYVVYPISIVQE